MFVCLGAMRVPRRLEVDECVRCPLFLKVCVHLFERSEGFGGECHSGHANQSPIESADHN